MVTVHGTAMIGARRRVLRQLLEALIFEGVLVPEERSESDGHRGLGYRIYEYRISGLDYQGNIVWYEFSAYRRFTFDMLTLTDQPVQRISDGISIECDDIMQWIQEVFHPDIYAYPVLPSFYKEIQHTLQHDYVYREWREQQLPSLYNASFAQMECRSAEGHPYHPCYRSRLGFSQEDNQAYSPEYEPQLSVFWLAAHEDEVDIRLSEGMEEQYFFHSILGSKDEEKFQQKLEELNLDSDKYKYIPLHPWQWQHYLKSRYCKWLDQQKLIPLGLGSTLYQPQQSIRTLTSCHESVLPDLKLSLHIVNTSSLRDLTMHSVAAAPAVSRWLQEVVNSDPYLREDAELIILREIVGISWLPAEGSASGIWRENIMTYLKPGEEALPFHALRAQEQNSPFLARWVERYGLESWFRAWIRQTIVPVVHLLVAHGIVLESHAQNMILIHRNGWPVRVALRDFHEGVEYYPPYLTAPELVPTFEEIHSQYASGKPGDYFEMPSLESLREMMIDALWFMNVGYLIMFLTDSLGGEERLLWHIVSQELRSYCDRNPQLRERFNELNLNTPFCEIEPLAQKRLFGKILLSPRKVRNPIYLSWLLDSRE